MTHPLIKIGISPFLAGSLAVSAISQSPQIQKVSTPPAIIPLPMSVGGRVQATHSSAPTGFGTEEHRHQWPGTYFETSFRGSELFFQVGTNHEVLHIVVDGKPPLILDKPESGTYRLSGLRNRPHTVNVLVATESQDAPNTFGGFGITAHFARVRELARVDPELSRVNSESPPQTPRTNLPASHHHPSRSSEPQSARRTAVRLRHRSAAGPDSAQYAEAEIPPKAVPSDAHSVQPPSTRGTTSPHPPQPATARGSRREAPPRPPTMSHAAMVPHSLPPNPIPQSS